MQIERKERSKKSIGCLKALNSSHKKMGTGKTYCTRQAKNSERVLAYSSAPKAPKRSSIRSLLINAISEIQNARNKSKTKQRETEGSGI